jgi:hypothetical protein
LLVGRTHPTYLCSSRSWRWKADEGLVLAARVKARAAALGGPGNDFVDANPGDNVLPNCETIV